MATEKEGVQVGVVQVGMFLAEVVHEGGDVHDHLLGDLGEVGVHLQCGCQACDPSGPLEGAFQEDHGRAEVVHREVAHEAEVVLCLARVPLEDGLRVEVGDDMGPMQGSRTRRLIGQNRMLRVVVVVFHMDRPPQAVHVQDHRYQVYHDPDHLLVASQRSWHVQAQMPTTQ